MSPKATFDPKSCHRALVSLSDSLRRRKLILILGSGISIPAGLPSWDKLVRPLREALKLPEPGPDVDSRLTDPLVIAEMYEQEFGKPALRTEVVRQIRHVTEPTALHQALATLDIPAIFTTNWDQLAERALEKAVRPYFLVSRDSDYSYQVADNTLLLVKLHGDVNSPSEIIVTKSDVLDYHRTHPNILSGFKDRLKTHTALLVGVSLKDPNLEGIIELALRDLKGHEPKHFILVHEWPESLARYYRLHSLETISLAHWDHAVPFIKELIKRSKQETAAEQRFPGTTISASADISAEIIEEVLEDAAQALEQQYKTILNAFNQGKRSSIRRNAEDLCNRLIRRKEKPFRSLTAQALLLSAQIALQSPPATDTKRAQQCLDEAKKLIDKGLKEQFEFVSAMLDFFRGDPASAVEKLERLSGDGALKLRLGILMVLKKFEECERIIQETGKTVGDDEGWDQLFAEFFMKRGDFDTAFDAIKPWVDREDASAISLELAGYILAFTAEQKHRKFCEKYYLFRQFSVILEHHRLVERNVALAASDYFEKASKAFEVLEENYRASESLEQAHELRSICHIDSEELDQLADRVLRFRIPDVAVEKGTLERLGRTSIKDFENFIRQTDLLPYILTQLKRWARNDRERLVKGAELLEKNEIKQRFRQVEEQAMLVTFTTELWSESGNLEQALKAIEDFTPPVEYSYFPEVLRAILYLNQQNEAEAAEVILVLEEEYSGNPIALALLCEWYERREDWEHMLGFSDKLLNIIEIPQTFDYYLTALGRLEKWSKALEGLDRAEKAGIELSLSWTIFNRARAHIALGHEQQALELYETGLKLERQGVVKLSASDLLNLMVCYAISGDRNKALETAKTVTERFPKNRDGHIKLVQLLKEENHQDEAFKAAKCATEILPDDDTIQATYIETGLMTGHGEEVAEALKEFPKRFPDSKALRMVPQEEGFRLYHEALEHAAWSEQMYRKGELPAVQSAYMQSTVPSYFRFWHAAKRTRSGLYVACGDQRNELELLRADDSGSLGSAVFDFPALIGTFEFQKEFPRWLNGLKKTFKNVYVPQSFRRILAVERSSLSGNLQIDRYNSLKQIRNIIDSRLERFPQIQIDSQLKDHIGHETERTFAEKSQLLYLNEYSDESERIELEIGFLELEALLSSSARITPLQRERMRDRAKERTIRPLRDSQRDNSEIVIDMMSLHSLSEMGVLEPLLAHFDKIHISELGWQWLISEIASSEFAEEMAERFKQFEIFLKDLDGFLEWIPVEVADRDAVWGEKKNKIKDSDPFGVMSYSLDLHIVAAEKKCALMTDDRWTKMTVFNDTAGREALNKIQRFGSDTLLRYLHQSGIVDLNTFVSIYAKLIDWNYRHLPVEPEFILSKIPKDSSGLSEAVISMLRYYEDSLREFVTLAKERPRKLTPGPLKNVMSSYNEAMAEILTKMFLRGNKAAVAGMLIKELAWTNLLEDYRVRAGEYLRALIANLMASGGSEFSKEEGDRSKKFWAWIDNAFKESGFRKGDIDWAWTGTIHNIMNREFAATTEERIRRAGIARLLDVLPERTREAILRSYLGNRFKEEFGWQIDTGQEYTWRVKEDDGLKEISIKNAQVEEVIRTRMLESLAHGIEEEIVEGLRLIWDQKSSHSLLISVTVLPAHPDIQPSTAPSVLFTSSMLAWLFEEDKRLREEVWKRGRQKLEHHGADTEQWRDLWALLSDSSAERYTEGARKCIDLLMSHPRVAADLITESILGEPEIWKSIVAELKPNHVSRWLDLDDVNWASKNELISRVKSKCDRLQFNDEENWKQMRELAFQSIFPDAEVFRRAQVAALSKMIRSEDARKSAGEVALGIVAEAEHSPAPAFKINAALTVIEFSARNAADQQSFWETHIDGRIYEPLQRRVQGLLLDSLATTKLTPNESDKKSEMLAVAAQWASTLFSIWAASGSETQRNRYLCCIAGGYLATRLADSGVMSEISNWGLFRQHLDQLERQFSHFDSERGFYRPGLARYLVYPAAYLVHGLNEYLKEFKNYLLNESLQKRMLEVPIFHRIFYGIAGGSQGLGERWLDDSLDKTEKAGIEGLLQACVGDSIEFWDSGDRQKLEQLLQPVEVENIIDQMFETIPRLPEKAVEAHGLLLFHMVWLAFEVDAPHWQRWMCRWFERVVLSRLVKAPIFYSVFVLNVARSLLVPHMGGASRQHIEALLFCRPEDALSEDQLVAHSLGIQFLATMGQYIDRLYKWFRAAAFEGPLSLEIRRGIIRSWANLFDDLPEMSQKELKRILQELVKKQDYRQMSELLRFGEGEADV